MPNTTRSHYRHAWVFVGEQRSPRAQQLGVTWDHQALCSKTLHDALRACGVTGLLRFVNIRDDAGLLDVQTLHWLARCDEQGATIIALGQKVQAVLRKQRVPFVAMIHPAARGTIRKRERYQQHVREVMALAGALLTPLPCPTEPSSPPPFPGDSPSAQRQCAAASARRYR
jgi:hypothetical protein